MGTHHSWKPSTAKKLNLNANKTFFDSNIFLLKNKNKEIIIAAPKNKNPATESDYNEIIKIYGKICIEAIVWLVN